LFNPTQTLPLKGGLYIYYLCPMRIDIITVLPELLRSPFEHSILKRAIAKGLVEVNLINLREYSTDKHKSVDDYMYGGGAGMVMMIEPIANCIEALQKERTYDEVIYTSPDGKLLDQPMANSLSLKGNLIILCGHYKGIDERIREHFITKEISIGDYVLSGGELAAAVISDSIIRLLPGVLSDETSALEDSFQDGLLAPPVYTRPSEFRGWKVPDVLLSGNFKEIDKWRHDKAIERTQERRPGLLSE
jgi:tRNA (guanine37-N1)-methyltransferase